MNILEVKHITKSFQSKKVLALDDVSFAIEEGECTLIAGECGSGKSVLMRIVSSLIKADSGTVRIEHNGKTAKAALVFQDADTQILGETPLEDVMFSLRRLPAKERRAAALNALEEVGLQELAECSARSLSGGQKRSLAIASVIALDRPLVIFDEPYSALDFPAVKRVNALIEHLIERGHTPIILTHETEKALPLAKRMIVLHKGKIVSNTTTAARPRGKDLEQWGVKEPASPWI